MQYLSSSISIGQAAELAECARQLQERWPLLYDYLEHRDRALDRALARIPSPADIELYGAFNVRAHLAQMLGQVPPGVGRLASEERING